MSQHNTATWTTQSQPSSRTARYWCHQCGSENPIYMAPDPTCQRCNSQFIEEIDDGGDDPRTFLAGATLDADDDDNDFDDVAFGDDMFQSFRRSLGGSNNGGGGGPRPGDDDEAPMDAMLQNILSGLLTSGGNDQDDMDEQQQRRRGGRSQQRTPMVLYRSIVDGTMQVTPLDMAESRRRRTGPNPLSQMAGDDGDDDDTLDDNDNERQGAGNNLQGLLQLISALTGAPMVGNPNDYVSSQAALDNIITQLMEQAGSGSAPPPAPDDVISGLPKRPVSEQEFKDQVDCAVCKDEFNVSELVVELPCQHLFHDDCIKPWLKVNGTCPVCRHSVVPSTTANEVNDNNETSSNQHDSTWSTTNHDDSDNGSLFEIDSLSYARRSYATQNTQRHLPTLPDTSTGPAAAPHFARLSRRPPTAWATTLPFAWGPGDNTYRTSRTRSTQDQPATNEPVDMDIDLD